MTRPKRKAVKGRGCTERVGDTGVSWRVVDYGIEWKVGGPWTKLSIHSPERMFLTSDRVLEIAQLFANPTETVDDDA